MCTLGTGCISFEEENYSNRHPFFVLNGKINLDHYLKKIFTLGIGTVLNIRP